MTAILDLMMWDEYFDYLTSTKLERLRAFLCRVLTFRHVPRATTAEYVMVHENKSYLLILGSCVLCKAGFTRRIYDRSYSLVRTMDATSKITWLIRCGGEYKPHSFYREERELPGAMK